MSQGWKLDGVDFFNYDVYVIKSSGVLDMPKMVDVSNDWLNLSGKDYWQPISDVKYNDNEITLNCFIESNSYANFKTAVNSFFAALISPNQRALTVPYLGSTVECYLNDPFKIRVSNYIRTEQIGIFTLKLTVRNDSKFNLIGISRVYSTTIIATAKTNNLKITKSLQGATTLTMSFESNTVLDIQKDDFVQYEYDGLGQDRFILDYNPSFTKISTNKYIYNLTFVIIYDWLGRAQFLNDLFESDFYYYGDMNDIVDLIVTNQGRTGYNKFIKGTVVSTIKKNHKFSSEDCFSVLKRISTEYGLEYEFQKQSPNWWDYEINVKTQVANDIAITLEYGKGNGGYKLKRGDIIKNEFFTKLYAYGSSKNLPATYRSGLRRLSFDANPLEQNILLYGYNEKTIYYEDIFPARTATVTGYLQVLKADLTDAQSEIWPNGIYRIEDTLLDFDINSYLIEGSVAKIIMKNGNVSGYEFDIIEYDHTNKWIYITPFNDSGLILPNALLQIAIGDSYTLVNIDQPASYIVTAENALQAAAVIDLAKGSTPKFEYSAQIDPKFIIDNSLFFEVGDRITLIDTDFGINGLFRISSLNYNDFTKVYDLTFSDKKQLTRIQVIEKQVEEQSRAAETTNSDTAESMRDSQQTVGDISRKLLNPIDEKLNVDNIVRNNSLDPGMISLDGGYIQAGLKGALLKTNVDNNEDKISFNTGIFTLRNANTLSRYEIAVLKSGGGTYNPTRSWIVPATNITIANKNEHEIYLKLDMTAGSTISSIVLSETHIETKQDSGFLYFNIGSVSGGEL